MFTNLSDIIKIPAALLIGALFSAIVLIFFYEGLSLPIVGQLIDGRVASQVKSATSTMVTRFERDALQAKLDKETRDRKAAEDAATDAKKREAATQIAKQQADAKVVALEADAKAKNLPGWSKEELEWYGILAPIVLGLMSAKGCQTLDERASAAAQVQGEATAAPQLPQQLDASCTVKMERVKPTVTEPRVVTLKRWDVVAENRDRKSDDCAAWWEG